MPLKKRRKALRKVLIGFGIVILLVAGFFTWEYLKVQWAKEVVTDAVITTTDSLYTITYDSLFLDEIGGSAFLKNIHISPDTAMVRQLSYEQLPSLLMDVRIQSIKVTGVKTQEALAGKSMVGDTVIINHPQIIMYTIKPLAKNTKIELEAAEIYQNILGKLQLIKVGYVLIDSINISSVDLNTGDKNFDFLDGNIQLTGVLIDSAHFEDTTRTLFCRSASFTVDSFFSYSHNRKELSIKNVAFSGEMKTLVFDEIALDRFSNDTGKGSPLLIAEALKFGGVNTDSIVKHKNLLVDTIQCSKIKVYEPPAGSLDGITNDNSKKEMDSTGFRNVYSIDLGYLHFGRVEFIPARKSNFELGNITLTIHDMKADKVLKVQKNPLKYSEEVEAGIESVYFLSKDKKYRFGADDLKFNSKQKTLSISEAYSKPLLGEDAFANSYSYQKDRFEVGMQDIVLKGILMETVFDGKLMASELNIQHTTAYISRDLNKPLEKKSKVGNYPSQLIVDLDFPINIEKANLPNVLVQYREKQVESQKKGTITFENSTIQITNITNIENEIEKNNRMAIDFRSSVLGKIPLKGNFTFILGSSSGRFTAVGHTQEPFDAAVFNKIAEPMALIHIRSGDIRSIDFDLKGNDHSARGKLTMKYNDLKVNVLKKEEGTPDLEKKGLVTFFANLVVQNSNPRNGELYIAFPEYERNIYKSFFNLVWKTILTGMKATVGLP